MKLLLLRANRYPAEILNGARTLLNLWTTSRTRRPYQFSMGTNFRKLKAPFLWYDLLHVAEVVSQVPSLRTEAAFLDMVSVLRTKAAETSLVPESVYLVWKDWDFGQKKRPSPWLEFCVERIRLRGTSEG